MSTVLGFPVDAEFAHNFHSLGEKFKLLNNTGAIELSVANAVYFKGTWKSKFKKSNTSDDSFFIAATAVIHRPSKTILFLGRFVK